MGSHDGAWPIATPIEGLEREASALDAAARRYFDHDGLADRELLLPRQRVVFSCQSLAVTTRLLHVSAWLMSCRAHCAGEPDAIGASRFRLPDMPASANGAIVGLPPTAQRLIRASIELHDRVGRLDRALDMNDHADAAPSAGGPARRLIERLHQAF